MPAQHFATLLCTRPSFETQKFDIDRFSPAADNSWVRCLRHPSQIRSSTIRDIQYPKIMSSKLSSIWKLLIWVMIPFTLAASFPRSACRCAMQNGCLMQGCCEVDDVQNGRFVPKCCAVRSKSNVTSQTGAARAPVKKAEKRSTDHDLAFMDEPIRTCHCGMVQGDIGSIPTSNELAANSFAFVGIALELSVSDLPVMRGQIALHYPLLHRSLDRVVLFSTFVI
jgi:hypothetical protein